MDYVIKKRLIVLISWSTPDLTNDVELAQRTSSVAKQPLVNTPSVELMLAGQDPQPLKHTNNKRHYGWMREREKYFI